MTEDNQYENPLAEVSPNLDVDEVAQKMDNSFTTKWREVEIQPDEYLNPEDPFEEPEWAMTKDDIPCMSFSDYHYIQGQKGNGKTFTFSIFEAAILKGQWGPLKYVGVKRPKPKVLHIDTEQSKGNVQLVKARVYHMAGWAQGDNHSDQYRILMLKRTASPKARWQKVIKACYDYKPDFIFIDGMLDVVAGMNDEEECNLVIGEAGALAETMNTAVMGICHENPTSQETAMKGDTKPAGHLGSFSERKGASGFGTVKERNMEDTKFHVLEKKARNKDFGDFKFRIKDEPIEIDGKTYWIGIPYWIDGSNDSTDDTPDEYQPIKDALLSIQWAINGLRYTDIEAGLKAYGITSKRKLSDYITMAMQKGILEKNEDTKRYFILYDGVNLDTQTRIANNSLGDAEGGDPF